MADKKRIPYTSYAWDEDTERWIGKPDAESETSDEEDLNEVLNIPEQEARMPIIPAPINPAATIEKENLDELELDTEEPLIEEPAAPAISPSVSPYSNLMSTLDNALREKDRARALSGLTRGAAGIAGGVAQAFGGQFKPDEATYKAIEDSGTGSLENIKTKLDVGPDIEMTDPASDISKVYREMAKKSLGRDIPESVSAKTLEKVLGKAAAPGSMFASGERWVRSSDGAPVTKNKQTGQFVIVNADGTQEPVDPKDLMQVYAPSILRDPTIDELAGFKRSTKGISPMELPKTVSPPTGKEPLESKVKQKPDIYANITERSKKLLDDSIDKFNTEIKDDKEATAKVMGIAEMIGKESLDNSASIGAVKGGMAKIFEGGRLTDEDVERYARRAGILDSMVDKLSELSTGTWTKEKAQQTQRVLKSYADVLQNSILIRAKSKAKEVSGRLETRNNERPNPEDILPRFVDITPYNWGSISEPGGQSTPKSKVSLQTPRTPGSQFKAKGRLYRVLDDGKTAEEI